MGFLSELWYCDLDTRDDNNIAASYLRYLTYRQGICYISHVVQYIKRKQQEMVFQRIYLYQRTRKSKSPFAVFLNINLLACFFRCIVENNFCTT